MAGYEDDEDWFDNDLDDLPVDALAELEHNAIQFTQAVKAPPSSDYGDEFEDDDLDDAVVIDEARSAAVPPALHRNIAGQSTQREQFREQRYGTPRNRPQQETALSVSHRPSPQPLSIPNGPRESKVAKQGSSPAPDYQVEALQKQIQEVSHNDRTTLFSAKIIFSSSKNAMFLSKTSMPSPERLPLSEASKKRPSRNMRGNWWRFESSMRTK